MRGFANDGVTGIKYAGACKKPTLEKVLKAIEALNYVPDANARSLVQQKTKTIALLSGPLHNPFLWIQQQP